MHIMNKYKKECIATKIFIANMPVGSIDTVADPKVDMPEEIDPKSLTNLEILYHMLGGILEKLMEKQSMKESKYK